MALPSFAALTVNGSALSGDVSLASIGGVDVSSDHIEVAEVRFGAQMATLDSSPGRIRGARRILPVRLVKRLDGSTPDLYRALATNATVAGEVKIFDTNPEDGSTRHRFTVTISGARILSVQSATPNAWDDDAPTLASEVVELVPHTITYTDVVNAREYTDEWSTVV